MEDFKLFLANHQRVDQIKKKCLGLEKLRDVMM